MLVITLGRAPHLARISPSSPVEKKLLKRIKRLAPPESVLQRFTGPDRGIGTLFGGSGPIGTASVPTGHSGQMGHAGHFGTLGTIGHPRDTGQRDRAKNRSKIIQLRYVQRNREKSRKNRGLRWKNTDESVYASSLGVWGFGHI
jgi:hypothetical protein